jgi:hypothetical protein
VEAVCSKERGFVEHVLPWQLQSKQYKAKVTTYHATESAGIGTNVRENCLRNFNVILNNGLYSSCTFKDLHVQSLFYLMKLTSVEITENVLILLYSLQSKPLSKCHQDAFCIIATYH